MALKVRARAARRNAGGALRADVLGRDGRPIGEAYGVGDEGGSAVDALRRAWHGAELVVEAMAVEGVLPVQVTVAKVDDGWIGVGHELETPAGLGGP